MPPVLLTVRGPRALQSYKIIGPEFLIGNRFEKVQEHTNLTCDGFFKAPVNLQSLEQNWWLRSIWNFPENLNLSNLVVQEAIADLQRLRDLERCNSDGDPPPYVLVVPVQNDSDLVSLRKYQTTDTILICAAAEIAFLMKSFEFDSQTSTVGSLSFSEIMPTRKTPAEVLDESLHCKLREGVNTVGGKAYYGCLYQSDKCTADQIERVQKILQRFSGVCPRVFVDKEEDKTVIRSGLPVGNLSFRAFGGEGLYNRLKEKIVASLPCDALNFDWLPVLQKEKEGEEYTCDICKKKFHSKDEPLRKFAYIYCSLMCVNNHRKANWKNVR